MHGYSGFSDGPWLAAAARDGHLFLSHLSWEEGRAVGIAGSYSI